MAKAANVDQVRADMRPANYRGAVKLLRTIDVKKSKIQGVTAEIGDIFAKVEGHKVNKKAARMFLTLDGMEEADRADVMRSLNGLAAVAEWPETTADLVDTAEGNVVKMRFGTPDVDDDGEDDEEIADDFAEDDGGSTGGDDFEEASEAELAKQDGRGQPKPGTGAAAIADMNTAAKKKSSKEIVEAYTGDNSDLAMTE